MTAKKLTKITHTHPTIGSSSTLGLAENLMRTYALFETDSDETIYIKINGDAAVMNQGIRINATGSSYEMSSQIGNLTTDAIYGICTSGGKVLLVTEGE